MSKTRAKPKPIAKEKQGSSTGTAARQLPDPPIFKWLPLVLLVVALAYYLWAVSIGWDHTIVDRHPFRQTQTAISTYYMVKQPFKLAYETPVLGPPWSIPMEFPIYQWITAGLVRIFGSHLDQTGRFVSIAFYLLTLIPAYFLLGTFRVAPSHRLAAISLLLASPFYIFWSRTFMIETCAIFFCVCYVACAFNALQHRKLYPFILACLFGICAGLVKVTTVLPFCVAVGLFAIRDQIPLNFSLIKERWRLLVNAALLSSCPVLAGFIWARYADSIKEQNAFGKFLTSTGLNSWNFGTLDQRLSFQTWNVIIQRIPTLFSTSIVFWTGCLFIVFLCILCHSRWKQTVGCIALFFVSPAILTNLQFVHDYYMCANGIFLIGAAAFLIIGFLESNRWRPVGFILLGATLLAGAFGHQVDYLPVQKQNTQDIIPFAKQLRDSTKPDEVNVIVGLDWAPMLPYYSERRAFMLPEYGKKGERMDEARQAFRNLKGEKIGLVLIFPSRWSRETILALMEENGLPLDRVRSVN